MTSLDKIEKCNDRKKPKTVTGGVMTMTRAVTVKGAAVHVLGLQNSVRQTAVIATEIKIVGWCALLPLYSYKFVGNIVMSDPLIKYRFRAAAVRIVEAENETKGHRDRSTHNGLLLTHLLYNMSKIIYIFFN